MLYNKFVVGGVFLSFMQSYKRLDNLCKDLFHSAHGVTSYIEAMEKCPRGAKTVNQWQTDYSKLKHYRYIRNRIAHENNADESILCKIEDTRWLDRFYNRIINGTDPLTLYRKKPIASPTRNKAKNKSPSKNNKKSKGLLLLLLLLLIAVLIVLVTEIFRN